MAPLHPWEWPGKPWSRIHIDYAGPFQGRMFLVIVDSHSKWLEDHVTHSASSARGRSRGVFGVSRSPPPEIYKGSQKNDVLVTKMYYFLN